MKRAIYLGITGLITGLISTHEVFYNSYFAKIFSFVDNDIVLFVIPGLIFGIFISLMDFILSRKYIYSHLLFILISSVAYYAAVSSVLISDESISMYLAGFIGSAILVVGLRFKYKLTFIDMLVFSAVGTIFVWPGNRDYLYPIWQCSIGATMGYLLETSEKE